jgi:hypothetical protein
VARRHHHRKVRRPPDPFPQDEESLFADFSEVEWGEHGMFTVGFITPGESLDEIDEVDDEGDEDDEDDDEEPPADPPVLV